MHIINLCHVKCERAGFGLFDDEKRCFLWFFKQQYLLLLLRSIFRNTLIEKTYYLRKISSLWVNDLQFRGTWKGRIILTWKINAKNLLLLIIILRQWQEMHFKHFFLEGQSKRQKMATCDYERLLIGWVSAEVKNFQSKCRNFQLQFQSRMLYFRWKGKTDCHRIFVYIIRLH